MESQAEFEAGLGQIVSTGIYAVSAVCHVSLPLSALVAETRFLLELATTILLAIECRQLLDHFLRLICHPLGKAYSSKFRQRL